MTKRTPQPPPPPVAVIDEATKLAISNWIDELGDLDRDLAPHRSSITRETAVKELVRKARADAMNAAPPTSELRVEGLRYYVLFGARKNETTISVKALVKAIGARAYSLFATTTLKALETHVAKDVAAACVSMGPTGSRTLKVFALKGVPTAESVKAA
jgi:hypothetical protein